MRKAEDWLLDALKEGTVVECWFWNDDKKEGVKGILCNYCLGAGYFPFQCEKDCEWYQHAEPYNGQDKPKYIPWTEGTCPLKCGDVLQNKTNPKMHRAITGLNFGIDEEYPFWLCASTYTFRDLFNDWLFNGKPCGQEVTE